MQLLKERSGLAEPDVAISEPPTKTASTDPTLLPEDWNLQPPRRAAMDALNTPFPKITTQPPTVDFIHHRLPNYHPMFVDPPVHYDPASRQYLPNNQELVPCPSSQHHHMETHLPVPQRLQYGAQDEPLSHPRPEWTDIKTMQFWNALFPEALERFRSTVTEPKDRAKTEYNIRILDNWDAVYEKLEKARAKYQSEGGRVGLLRKVRRKAADRVLPVAEITKSVSKVAPNDPYATPVLGAVQILLDAVQVAADVRNQVLTGFDGLIPAFSDVELFLGTFPRDVSVRNASLELTVATLVAVERAIGFFIRNEVWKGLKAVGMGSHYESELLQSLGDIEQKSRKLKEEADKSHMFESRMVGKQVLIGMEEMNQLLTGHLIERDLQIAFEREMYRRDMEASRQEVAYLHIENARLHNRACTPQENIVPSHQGWDRNELRQYIGAQDIDMDDCAFAVDQTNEFPARERTLVEQIIHTKHFQDWIRSPLSAKLLVHWDGHLPKTLADMSPLTLFCVSMTQILRANHRFVTGLWICGRHADPYENYAGGYCMVASLVDQLLRDHDFDMFSLVESGDIDFDRIQPGQPGALEELLKILELLVQQLPETITLFCLIDGVILFEREEADALPVLACLLRLAGEPNLRAAVKILFTSTPGCDIVRAPFEDHDLILNVDGLQRLVWAPSEERVARELNDYMGDY